MSREAGKTIVLTGCSRGLGRAMSEYFASQGAIVLGCSRDRVALAELSAKLGSRHAFEAVDVSNDAQVRQWAEKIQTTHGAPDLLLNNAAIINRSAPLWELESDEVESLLGTNLLGTINCIHHFTPKMLRRGKGVIVNFSSGWGRSTSPEVASYCASKWAIEGLTRSLAQDLAAAGGSVAAVALNPGVIDTQMLRSCLGDSASNYPRPEDWARHACPLILALSDKDNGRTMDVPPDYHG